MLNPENESRRSFLYSAVVLGDHIMVIEAEEISEIVSHSVVVVQTSIGQPQNNNSHSQLYFDNNGLIKSDIEGFFFTYWYNHIKTNL